jgi:translation initiation factor eIF-2B subunit delta
MRLPEEIRGQIEAIRSDNTSGAVELAISAADTLAALAARAGVASASQLGAYLETAAQALIAAQPTMAPIFNLANETLLSIDGLRAPQEIRRAARAACRDFVSRLQSAGEKIGEITSNLIQDGTTVTTYSYSSTVLKALLVAQDAGRRFDVICPESRPMREGVALAAKLGQAGIAVRLIVDAGVFSLLPEAGVVLVGADSVSPQGLVNKIGTAGLALAAGALGVDIYALCSSQKFLPASYPPRPQELREPAEILAEPIPNVTVVNRYFDLTPLEHLTAIVTEDGIIRPDELRRRLESLSVHKHLLR